MGCATGLVKSVMFFFNFLFVLAGLALIALGGLFYFKFSTYEEVIDTQFQIAPTLVLILGVIVFIIAFFGCCGVCRESYCMLVTYAVLLLTIFALQLAIGVYAYLQVNENGDVQPLLEKGLEKVFNEYKTNTEAKELMDLIQKESHCCGVNGPSDYTTRFVMLTLPASCCRDFDTKSCTIITSWHTGCSERLSELYVSAVKTLSYVAIGIAAVEIIGSIFAICLASTLKNESRRRYA